MLNYKDFKALERAVIESIKRGSPLREGLKVLMLFHFFNMELAKSKKYLNLFVKYFGKEDRDIQWLYFILRFMAMEPLEEPKDPVQAFYYRLYYRGEVGEALKILEENRDSIRDGISPEFLHSLYIQVFTIMGRMYVIPERMLENMRGPMDAYLNINRMVAGDVLTGIETFKPGKFRFILFHPFSKRIAMVGRMIFALVEGDFLTYEAMLRNFDGDGERYLYTVGRILGSIFDPSLAVDEDEIPPYVVFLRRLNAYVRSERYGCGCPEEYGGVESFLWHIRKMKDRTTYLSFGGKLRLLRGIEEVHLPRRKALIVLGIMRSLGMEELRTMAPVIFPGSPRPLKTVYDYMRFIKEYRFVPTNLRFTLRSGIFLYDEDEPWARALRGRMHDRGRLNPPVMAKP